VAYLESLGRHALLAGTEERGSSQRLDPANEARMGLFCDCGIPRTFGPAVFLSTDLPPAELERFELRGAAVFARHCSGCHGASGKGDGPAAASLLPAPRDLTRTQFSDRALSQALWEGVPGTAMAPWRDRLDATERRLLAVYVRSLYNQAFPSR